MVTADKLTVQSVVSFSHTVKTLHKLTCSLTQGSQIAQLVEHPTEKPGAILTQVRVPGVARDFSPRVNFQRRLSYSVCTAPVCNRMHQHLCARSKSHTLAAMLLFVQIQILHKPIGMGIAAPWGCRALLR